MKAEDKAKFDRDVAMMNEHYCNGVADPFSCCPCHPAHGRYPKEFCTCKVSPEMAAAVDRFMEELMLEKWRERVNPEKEGQRYKWVLRDHKVSSEQDFKGNTYKRVECRLGRGSGPIDEDNICPLCHKEI